MKTVVDVVLHGVVPVPLVGDINGEFVCLVRYLDRDMGADEGSDPRAVDEYVGAVAQGDRHYQAWAVAEKARRDLIDSGLQEGRQRILTGIAYDGQDGEDSADRHIDIDIAGTVDGVHGNREWGTRIEQFRLIKFSGSVERHRGSSGFLDKQLIPVSLESLRLGTDCRVITRGVRRRGGPNTGLDFGADAHRGPRERKNRRTDSLAPVGFFKPVFKSLARH